MISLAEGLSELTRLIERGSGHLPAEQIERALVVRDQAVERQNAGLDTTVVALLGATGAGKSSLVNALAGANVATVTARRPTTRSPLAVSRASHPELLDWLEIPERVSAPLQWATHGERLILLDLPDIDSSEPAHRLIAERMADVVDVLIWVLDPQKYADAVVHEDFLSKLSEHGAVTLVVLNQIDRVKPADRPGMLRDAQRLLVADGLGTELIATSAHTGEGLDELTGKINVIADTQAAAAERLAADLRTLGAELSANLGSDPEGLTKKARSDIASAVASGAGVDRVAGAAAGSYKYRSRKHLGWPPLRWLRGVRVDPLKALHLLSPGQGSTPAVTGVRATPASESQVRSAIRTATQDAAAGMPSSWRRDAVEDAENRADVVLDEADAMIARADLGQRSQPTWWTVGGILQIIAFLIALAGLAWLGVLWGLSILQFPTGDMPMVGPLPMPTALLGAGLLLGGILTLVLRWCASIGASRVERRVRKQLTGEIRGVVDEHLLAGIDSELERYREVAGLACRLEEVRAPA